MAAVSEVDYDCCHTELHLNKSGTCGKRRITNHADEIRSGPQASQPKPSSPPWPQWTRTAHPRNDCSNPYCSYTHASSSSCHPTSPIFPDSQVPLGCNSLQTRNDTCTQVQPDTKVSGFVQEMVQRMIDNVTGSQERHLLVKTLSFQKQIL